MRFFSWLLLWGMFLPAQVSAQQPKPESGGTPKTTGRWKLETVRLREGKEYHGLVQARREKEIDFAQITQRPGKPTSLIIRGIDLKQVEKVEMLPPPQHAELEKQFHEFRYRAVIEAGRMEEVLLTKAELDGHDYLAYRGAWFSLLSTADEESTRRCVVRIEQVFRAYRTLLPPREDAAPDLQIYLYSSLDEYRQRLKTLKLDVANPAVYSARQRTILAGSDLALFSERLAEVRRQAKELERLYDKLEKQFTQELATLSDQLRAKGFSKDEVASELQLRKTEWKNARAAVMADAAEKDRRNTARFVEVTQQMFARLYHEAFHAYLDNFVYPRDGHHVPTWLHEGLAQVFEGGQLEGDSLRIDAPDRDRLSALVSDLNSPSPLPLARLLTAEERTYIGEHGGQASRRHYLYAWGLSYYLVTHKNLLGSSALDRYVSSGAQEHSPPARLEQLLGQPLDKFEPQWQEAMRKLAEPQNNSEPRP